MRIDEWLKKATKNLDKANIGTARLDALVLLEDVLKKDRSYLLAHPEIELENQQIEKLDKQIKRRSVHDPLAYIRGKTEFYGRQFKIDERVLEPRPESETMIDLVKALRLTKTPHIADIGTGSGAIGITVVLEIPGSTTSLVDIDPKCLEVARQNVELHEVTANILQGNLIEPLTYPAEVILANLPYVPDSYHINEAALKEPKIAIYGGEDGLDLYRELFKQLGNNPAKYVLTESLPFQHTDLTKIAQTSGYKLAKTDDFIQVFAASPYERGASPLIAPGTE